MENKWQTPKPEELERTMTLAAIFAAYWNGY